MQDGEYNYIEAFKKMMFLKEHHRPVEVVVADLQSELRSVKEVSLLIHAMRMILELDFRSTSPLYQHLQSPNLYVHPNMEQKQRCVEQMFSSLK